MSSNLKKYFATLEVLCKLSNPKIRKSVIKDLSKDECFCRAVREIVKNTVNGNVKLSASDKKKLRKHKCLLIELAKKRKGNRKTKQLIQQSGTGVFLPVLVPIVASLLSELLRK